MKSIFEGKKRLAGRAHALVEGKPPRPVPFRLIFFRRGNRKQREQIEKEDMKFEKSGKASTSALGSSNATSSEFPFEYFVVKMENSLATYLIIFLNFVLLNAETTIPWYENLPAVAMDYKVHIDAGKEDCYFQFVNPGATFYVSFQVLRGGDGMAGFAVHHPSGAIVHPYQWRPHSEYQDENSSGGYYSVCIDNQFSRFSSKLVNLYLTVVRPEKLNAFSKELEAMDLSVASFTESLMKVQNNINEILQHQHFSRGREARDYNILLDNKSYVQNWSIAQICVIVVTTATQVYFVRKLFDVKSRTRA